jgi:peptidoglycan/LPS O-acetylase OafA/YrhL
LRTLAVIPVIFFHAGFDSFRGGFVGVDIFFVISGYLITSLILTELDAGSFTLARFYERRARRILPALLFVTTLCVPFAYLWMYPKQLVEFSNSVVAVSTLVSNFLFYKESGYFASAAELKPLLHTWSLAVEEQYYVAFPLFMAIFWGLGKRRLVVLISAVALLSLFCAQFAGNINLSSPYLIPDWQWFKQPTWASFYLPVGRIW